MRIGRRIRRAVAKLHRWTGLVLGLGLAFVGLTGSAVVFQPEIDRWLNPALHRVEPAAAGPMAPVVAAAVAVFPHGEPSFVRLRLPPESGRSAGVMMKDRFGAGSAPFHEVFVDPATARVLGDREAESSLSGILIGLHAHLLLGDHGPGETAVGLLGIALVVFCVSGLYLWWPAGWRRGVILRLRFNRGWAAFSHDLHRSLGLVLLVPLLLSGLTGLFLVFPGYVRPPLIALLDAPRPPPAPKAAPREGPVIDVDRALALARAAAPGAEPTAVMVPRQPRAAYEIRLREPGDRRQHYSDGGTVVHLDPHDGAVLALRRTAERPVGGRLLFDWIFPTHSGEIAGLAGRIAMFAGGLAPAILFATGFYLWFRRRRRRVSGRGG